MEIRHHATLKKLTPTLLLRDQNVYQGRDFSIRIYQSIDTETEVLQIGCLETDTCKLPRNQIREEN